MIRSLLTTTQHAFIARAIPKRSSSSFPHPNSRSQNKINKEQEQDFLLPKYESAVSAWPPRTEQSPVAPGFFTYKWPLNVLVSGAHRVSGVALVVGFSSVVYGSTIAFPKGGFSDALNSLGNLPRPLICSVRWCVGFPLFYHWLAGLRFVLWDLKLLNYEQPTCFNSSVAIITTASIASLFLSTFKFPLPKAAKNKEQQKKL